MSDIQSKTTKQSKKKKKQTEQEEQSKLEPNRTDTYVKIKKKIQDIKTIIKTKVQIFKRRMKDFKVKTTMSRMK